MTPSLLLTPLAPTPGGTAARPEALATGLASASASYDAYYDDAYRAPTPSGPNRTIAACQWTGAPIRAIVPLPRRKGHALDEKRVCALGAPGSFPAPTPTLTLTSSSTSTSTPGSSTVLRRHRSRAMSIWDEEHDSDIRAERSEDNNDSDDEVTTTRGYCSYESITAAEGLAGRSFEELRVECYAQSLVARGTKPPPVARPSLAIPPAFVPRIVPRYS